jgi:hypothetical protein
MIEPHRKQTLDEEEQKSLRSMLRALQPFRELRQDMPLQYVASFLWVAVNEGLGVTDYAQRAGVAQSVMTRHLLDLGERDRRMGVSVANPMMTYPAASDLRGQEGLHVG